MPKMMRFIAIFSTAGAALAAAFFQYFQAGTLLTLAITFGTIAYHFGIRLLTGLFYNAWMKNRADYTKKWYRVHPWETKLYRFLRVKAWKNKMPAYDPLAFSSNRHTWDEVAQAMCQSELIHETNMALSFIPVIASKWFGAFHVFLLTSLCGALFDLPFIIMQRYNRPRVLKIAARKNGLP